MILCKCSVPASHTSTINQMNMSCNDKQQQQDETLANQLSGSPLPPPRGREISRRQRQVSSSARFPPNHRLSSRSMSQEVDDFFILEGDEVPSLQDSSNLSSISSIVYSDAGTCTTSSTHGGRWGSCEAVTTIKQPEEQGSKKKKGKFSIFRSVVRNAIFNDQSGNNL
jgi:hypothetical protein